MVIVSRNSLAVRHAYVSRVFNLILNEAEREVYQSWFFSRFNMRSSQQLPSCMWSRGRSTKKFRHSGKGCYASNVPLRPLPCVEKPVLKVITRSDIMTIADRLATFDENWNERNPIPREILARHGFIRVERDGSHSGDDTTQCFSCGAWFYD